MQTTFEVLPSGNLALLETYPDPHACSSTNVPTKSRPAAVLYTKWCLDMYQVQTEFGHSEAGMHYFKQREQRNYVRCSFLTQQALHSVADSEMGT